MKNNPLLETAIKASISAGKVLMEHYSRNLKALQKESSRDIATEVDRLAENAIISILKEYDDTITIITEEQGEIVKGKRDRFWLVDALDGTVNYVNHIPFFSVSIAFIENGVTSVGAIYLPTFDDIYFGARGVGAFKNHETIKSKKCDFSDALFAASFSGKNYDPNARPKEFQLFSEINDKSRGCLRTGSASLNLAFLAEGRLDGCWGKANKAWDISAGLLLAELAGCKVAAKSFGEDNQIVSYLACGKTIWDKLYPQVNQVLLLT